MDPLGIVLGGFGMGGWQMILEVGVFYGVLRKVRLAEEHGMENVDDADADCGYGMT